MNSYLCAFLTIYFICHIPAFLLLIIGLIIRHKNKERATLMFILSGIYFLIGGGICAILLMPK